MTFVHSLCCWRGSSIIGVSLSQAANGRFVAVISVRSVPARGRLQPDLTRFHPPVGIQSSEERPGGNGGAPTPRAIWNYADHYRNE
jgi:hypothetical protein